MAPILKSGLVPVYVDVDLETYVAKSELLGEAISPRTKVITMALTLGYPFDAEEVLELAKK